MGSTKVFRMGSVGPECNLRKGGMVAAGFVSCGHCLRDAELDSKSERNVTHNLLLPLSSPVHLARLSPGQKAEKGDKSIRLWPQTISNGK